MYKKKIKKNEEPKIMGICEVYPKNSIFIPTISELKVNGYELYLKKHESGERGIAIYIHKSLSVNEVAVKGQSRESLWLEAKLNNDDVLLIGCVYRSPSNTAIQNNVFIEMIQEMTQRQYTHLLLMGDFNLPYIDWNVWEAISQNPSDMHNRLLEILRDAFLFQHVDMPTRGRVNNQPSLIDLILTNEQGMISDLEILSPLGKSDHACIKFWFNCYVHLRKVPLQKFLYDKGDYNAIREELNEIKWEDELTKRNSVNEKWTFIRNRIQDSAEKNIPKSNIKDKFNVKYKAPLDEKSLGKLKKKHRLWKKYIRTKDSDVYKEFCRARNEVRKLTKKARRMKEKGVSEAAKDNPKKFWNYVNNKTKTKPGIPDLKNQKIQRN